MGLVVYRSYMRTKSTSSWDAEGNKDENIAGFIAVLIIQSIKYSPGSRRNETRKISLIFERNF